MKQIAVSLRELSFVLFAAKPKIVSIDSGILSVLVLLFPLSDAH